MIEMQDDARKAGYTCPKCGGPAELCPGYDTLIACPKCGETRIIMDFLPNGDIQTVTADTGEYYELEMSVRDALAHLDEVKSSKYDDEYSRQKDIIKALSDLAAAYNGTGREVKAENIASDVLDIMYDLSRKGHKKMRDRYLDQIAVCSTYAIARGDFAAAAAIYSKGLDYVGDSKDLQAASLKVNYSFLCTMRKDFVNAEKSLLDAKAIIEECYSDGDHGSDPYLLATVYDSLRVISGKNNNTAESKEYLEKAVSERKRLLSGDQITETRLIELTDSMGSLAEAEARGGDPAKAASMLDEAIVTVKEPSKGGLAYAYAIMNRAKYQQSSGKGPSKELMDDMDIAIPIMVSAETKDKRLKENLAQAYMFRSMVRDPNDYDDLLSDIEGAYVLLLDLARDSDANEMFFMSVAHSYLVLLNMKHHEKAEKVRNELLELGISQKELDRATRGTIGNVSTKRTMVNVMTSNESKPMRGRRLKRQVKHKTE